MIIFELLGPKSKISRKLVKLKLQKKKIKCWITINSKYMGQKFHFNHK